MTAISRRAVTGPFVGALALALALAGASGVARSAPASNAEPKVSVKVGKPRGHEGRVRFVVRATDSDSRQLKIRVPSKTDKGRVTAMTSRDGETTGGFTYTPTAGARHASASDSATTSDQTDTFTVTVTDGHGGSTAVPVTVNVSPENSPPVAGAPVVNAPDPTTGVVKGAIVASDADADPLTYQVTTPPASGAVTVNPTTGVFTYTPTSVAPTLREIVVENPVTITFTVTITDGYGGSVSVPVNCPRPSSQ